MSNESAKITAQMQRLIRMAEDELTEYSSTARKIEKLRQKIALSVPFMEQKQIRDALAATMPTDQLSHLIETQRQTVALPFWGIAGLGALLGIALMQPFDVLAVIIGGWLAVKIQQRGWQLQAKRLVLQTLDDIANRIDQLD